MRPEDKYRDWDIITRAYSSPVKIETSPPSSNKELLRVRKAPSRVTLIERKVEEPWDCKLGCSSNYGRDCKDVCTIIQQLKKLMRS